MTQPTKQQVNEEEDIYASVEDTAKIVAYPSSNDKNGGSCDNSGVLTALNEWKVDDTRQWLQWAVSQDQKHLDPLLLALKKAVDGCGNENDDTSKRKRKRTAGQVVQVT